VRRKRATFITFLLLACLIGGMGLWLRAQQRRYALNRQLIAALIRGDNKHALALVNAGADPNTQYAPTLASSLTQLMTRLLRWSPSGNNNTPTALLIACGCPWDDEEMTFFTQANRPNDLQLVKAMLRHGANVNARDRHGCTPLLSINDDRDMMRLLIANGADVNAKTETGLTRLMFNNQSLDTVRLLVQYGANVNAADQQGETPLILKMQYGSAPGVATLLLEHGANVNARNSIGWTPLICGVQFNPDAVRLLLEHGANVNAQDENGETALYLAVQMSEPRTNSAVTNAVRQLLAHGANPNLPTNAGETPLKCAQRVRRPDLVALLRRYGAKKKQ
jgi:ankyrin repeat protein